MKIGEKVPAICLNDESGKQFCLQKFMGKEALVIYFYPKDFTPGCTKEACNFRDSYEGFQNLGAEVIGISSDSEASHSKFKERYKLPYILLADPKKKARNAFDVKSSLLGLLPGRETFVFDKSGILIHKFHSRDSSIHMPKALKILKNISA
ncbi:peroxiredoxin [Gramella sp. AN32]|uniref:thioredoxin-dependent peroxiredoxin n=1 Tax=Christiangramia antarctica TaxID=2058158 RepID=A0ABW5X9G2_9FLAO|nr:peroxiredoxin [Gramella sp. AN32]MCM4154627.1 peroxiredoxin [Gramella sp. AN32]